MQHIDVGPPVGWYPGIQNNRKEGHLQSTFPDLTGKAALSKHDQDICKLVFPQSE
jgi:hypothetical protein